MKFSNLLLVDILKCLNDYILCGDTLSVVYRNNCRILNNLLLVCKDWHQYIQPRIKNLVYHINTSHQLELLSTQSRAKLDGYRIHLNTSAITSDVLLPLDNLELIEIDRNLSILKEIEKRKEPIPTLKVVRIQFQAKTFNGMSMDFPLLFKVLEHHKIETFEFIDHCPTKLIQSIDRITKWKSLVTLRLIGVCIPLQSVLDIICKSKSLRSITLDNVILTLFGNYYSTNSGSDQNLGSIDQILGLVAITTNIKELYVTKAQSSLKSIEDLLSNSQTLQTLELKLYSFTTMESSGISIANQTIKNLSISNGTTVYDSIYSKWIGVSNLTGVLYQMTPPEKYLIENHQNVETFHWVHHYDGDIDKVLKLNFPKIKNLIVTIPLHLYPQPSVGVVDSILSSIQKFNTNITSIRLNSKVTSNTIADCLKIVQLQSLYIENCQEDITSPFKDLFKVEPVNLEKLEISQLNLSHTKNQEITEIIQKLLSFSNLKHIKIAFPFLPDVYETPSLIQCIKDNYQHIYTLKLSPEFQNTLLKHNIIINDK
ncbi:hypothetical protein DLAC_08544 [Tieghemostelium lacteum]|uniref:Uncharacterized protein n=1 Tax=Tieghemostelium lacteum TaxID=361077 RepID=A0A151Z861_TIELA|nr:hypothetical protein DLAC_08544 [Tieghemostelium lacteum]|eukprot:KYQ89974.1 hypothetical protein DLAC_08544 [Tieghemostelium lacteum]